MTTTIATNWNNTLNRINLLEYLRLNSPPLNIEYMPANKIAATTTIERGTNITKIESSMNCSYNKYRVLILYVTIININLKYLISYN